MNVRLTLAAVAMFVCMAGSQAQQAPQTVDWRYQIQPGDTLITLSEHWIASPRGWKDLQRLNRVGDPLRLKPGSTLRMPIAWLWREASVAEAVFVKGDVLVIQEEQSTALQTGATLRSGSRVRTGPQSSASLLFADGSRLLIPPQSDISLEQLLSLGRAAIPSVRLNLAKGSVDSRVTPNAQHVPLYEIRTPHVNLGVRGTEFRVQADDVASRMQVLSGAVRADGLNRDVVAGEGLLADAKSRAVSQLLPPPDLSTTALVAERLPLSLSWAASPPGAVAWRAQLYVQGDFDRLLLDSRVDQPRASWPEARDLPDAGYSLRVRAIDANGQEGAAADLVIRLQARPEPPFVQGPAPGAVSYAGSVVLAWTRNALAPNVRLQVARDAAFRDIALEPSALSATEFDVRLPDGPYYWRVASVDANGHSGPFGEAQTFELKPPPPSPPPATSETVGDQLTLRWRADEGVTRYELEWSKTADFATGSVTRFDTEKPQLNLPKPSPGTYYLRARAFNAAGAASPWGQVQVIEQPYPRWLWLLPLVLVPFF